MINRDNFLLESLYAEIQNEEYWNYGEGQINTQGEESEATKKSKEIF